MKRFVKEMIILILQLLMFYVFPLTAGPTDTMGMIIIIVFTTMSLSLILGCISKEKIKYLYPIVIAILFIPTIFIHYNETAFIYIVWYFVISAIGLGIGTLIRFIIEKCKKTN